MSVIIDCEKEKKIEIAKKLNESKNSSWFGWMGMGVSEKDKKKNDLVT